MGQFAIIQEEEGEWGLILKEPLDREAKDRYTLQITATDGKFQALATAEVHVLDVNDNSPECQQVSFHYVLHYVSFDSVLEFIYIYIYSICIHILQCLYLLQCHKVSLHITVLRCFTVHKKCTVSSGQ